MGGGGGGGRGRRLLVRFNCALSLSPFSFFLSSLHQYFHFLLLLLHLPLSSLSGAEADGRSGVKTKVPRRTFSSLSTLVGCMLLLLDE